MFPKYCICAILSTNNFMILFPKTLSRILLTLMLCVFLVSLGKAQINSRHKTFQVISNKGNSQITTTFQEKIDFNNAYLDISVKDQLGIDTIEILNESTGQTLTISFAKSSPIYSFSDRYLLKDLFERSNRGKLSLKMTAKNVKNERNSVNITINVH